MAMTGALVLMQRIILKKPGPPVMVEEGARMMGKVSGQLPIIRMGLYGMIASEEKSVSEPMVNSRAIISPILRY